ncbi:MAG: TonB-dependent receptor plug domain-containing protein [Opitutaceae bacterium]
MTQKSPPRFRRVAFSSGRLALGLFVVAGSALARAQVVSTAAMATSVPKEEAAPVVLSPFSVTADTDSGYQAANTLAGSRLNTKLSETPASVSVFTEEFLKDLGATGLAQVLEYGVNANADFNAVTTAPSFFYLDGGLLNDARVNNRGLAGSKTVDFLETTLPIDTYNTGRFEVSSGPNSVLFGFGSAGGIINAQTRVADLRRTAVKLNGTVGSWSAYRGELDVNVVALKDRVGVRVMAVHDEAETWRRYADRKSDRWSIVGGFKPFPATTVTALYEHGDISLPSDRPYNRVDALSFWWRQGQPKVDNTSFGTGTSTVQNAFGIRGTGIKNIFVSNDGRPIFSRTGSANTVVYQSASIYETGMNSGIPSQRVDPSGTYATLLPTAPRADELPYAPYDINYYGPERRRENTISRKFFRLEQKIGRDGFIELAFNEEAGSGFSHQLTGSFTLNGDPNLFLPNPDGTATRVANPNAGKLYVEQVNYHNFEDTVNRVMRATGSWKLDLGRWGEHRLAGMAEQSINHYRTGQGAEILVNAATGVPILNAAAPENAQNYLYRRNYVTPGSPETYIPSPRVESQPIVFGGATYKPRLITSAGTPGANRQIDSLMAATQSRFFGGRLIATGGLRRDQVDIVPLLAERLTASDPRVASGQFLLNQYGYTGEDTAGARSYEFTTYTAGAVVRVTKWLSAFYNQSNNNGAPQTTRRILPDVTFPPPPEALGRDYGAMFSFLDGRIFIRATAYHTEAKNDPTVRDNAFILAHRRILNAIRDSGRITQAEVDSRSISAYLGDFLSDLDTKGYEFELKANPTRNWTITAAYSYTKLQRSNLGQEWFPWFATQKAYYAQFPSNLITTANIPISTEVAQVETGVANLFALNQLGYNNRPHKANTFTRYSFSEGRLKGWFLGGGVRWQDKNILQRDLIGFDALGKDVLGKILYGPEIFNVDALAGYSTKLKSGLLGVGTTLRVQLNIANLLDNDDAQIIRINRVDGGYWRVVPREPRSFRLSVALGF